MAIAIDSISKSIDQTTNFFKGPNLLKKIAIFAILIFIFTLGTGESIGGGGGNFNTSDFSTIFENNNALEKIGETNSLQTNIENGTNPLTGLATLPNINFDFEKFIPLIIAVILLLFVIGFVLRVVGEASFFAILDSIKTNKVSLALISKNISSGLNLTILETILGVLSIPFLLLFFTSIIGFLLNLFKGLPALTTQLTPIIEQFPLLGDTSTLLLFGIVGFFGMIFFGLINYFLKQFGVYLMHKEKIGSFESLRRGIGLAFGNIAELILLIFVQIGLGIVIGILAAIIGLILIIPLIIIGIVFVIAFLGANGNLIVISLLAILGLLLLLLFSYANAFLLSPIYVFIFNYNMNVLEGFMKK